MLPAIYNPTIKQGVPFRRVLIITDDTGMPIDMTGATGTFRIVDASGATLADLAFEVVDGAAGKVAYNLADTTGIPDTNGVAELPYDAFVQPALGDRICPIEGLVTVEKKHSDLP